MGTVIVLPDLKPTPAIFKQLDVGRHQLQIINYRTYATEAVNYETLATAIEQTIRQASQPITLIGDGIGATLALKVATKVFGRIDNLFLIKPQFQIPTARLKRQGLKYRLMGSGSFSDFPLDKAPTIKLLQSLYHLDLTKDLMHIQCPTTVFCGSRDLKNKPAAQGLSNRLFDGHLVLVDKMDVNLNEAGLKAINSHL